VGSNCTGYVQLHIFHVPTSRLLNVVISEGYTLGLAVRKEGTISPSCCYMRCSVYMMSSLFKYLGTTTNGLDMTSLRRVVLDVSSILGLENRFCTLISQYDAMWSDMA